MKYFENDFTDIECINALHHLIKLYELTIKIINNM